MDKDMHDTRLDTSLRLGTWLLGVVVALAAAAALASLLLLDRTDVALTSPARLQRDAPAAPAHDQPVVSTADPGDALHPGASIAAYGAP